MPKFADYLRKTYQTDYASFIPNSYRLYYGEHNGREKFCISCKDCIEKGDKFVNMFSASKQYINNHFYMCVECGEECAEIHDMKITNY